MKELFNLLTYPLSVIEDPFWDFVLLTVIGSLSFVIAWNFVGETGIRGKMGSILHWTVRLIVMLILCFITSLCIKLIIFIRNIQLVTWIALGIIIIITLFVYFIMKFTIFSKKEKQYNSLEKQKNRYIILARRIINNYYLKKTNVFSKEDIIDKDNFNDEYIFEEITNMLKNEKLIKTNKNDSYIIELKTICFLEQYVKDDINYTLNALVFIITLITLIITTFNQFNEEFSKLSSAVLSIVIIILIFKSLPNDKRKI